MILSFFVEIFQNNIERVAIEQCDDAAHHPVVVVVAVAIRREFHCRHNTSILAIFATFFSAELESQIPV